MPPNACSFSASRRSRAEGNPRPRSAVGWETRSSGETDCQEGCVAGSHRPPAAMAVASALPISAGLAAAAL
eukprot:6095254-Alexandrium_andersonii.AAC.1